MYQEFSCCMYSALCSFTFPVWGCNKAAKVHSGVSGGRIYSFLLGLPVGGGLLSRRRECVQLQ